MSDSDKKEPDPKQDPIFEPDEGLRRMLNTPPKPHIEKSGKAKSVRAKPVPRQVRPQQSKRGR